MTQLKEFSFAQFGAFVRALREHVKCKTRRSSCALSDGSGLSSGASLTLPLLVMLPDALTAHIIAMAGPLDQSYNVSMTCKGARAQLWDNHMFWQSLTQILDLALCGSAHGLSSLSQEFSVPMVSVVGSDAGLASHLRERLRRRCMGVDWLVNLVRTGDSPLPMLAGVFSETTSSLEGARRAVLALGDEEDSALVVSTTASLSFLLGARREGRTELQHAEALLEAVAFRADIFSTSQMLEILGAHQRAEAKLDLVTELPPRKHGARSSGSHRMGRRCQKSRSDTMAG